MANPIDINLPHKLGKEEARRRIAGNIGSLEKHIPGGAKVQSSWTGDTLNLSVQAMGEQVSGQIDVRETLVNLKLQLPGMLGMFSGMVAGMIEAKGGVLLEDHSKKG